MNQKQLTSFKNKVKWSRVFILSSLSFLSVGLLVFNNCGQFRLAEHMQDPSLQGPNKKPDEDPSLPVGDAGRPLPPAPSPDAPPQGPVDPLLSQAWHLKNTGQSGFSAGVGIAGEDINLADLHELGYTGKGVVVAVSDSGVELTHEDMANNTVLSKSRDYTRASMPWEGFAPQPENAQDGHGTVVMGVIGAQMNNGVGLRGVAPLATLYGFNYIISNQSRIKGADQATGDDIAVFNYSYGRSTCANFQEDSLLTAALRQGVEKQRNGLGSVYVASAGNDFVGRLNSCFRSQDPARNEELSNTFFFGNANRNPSKAYPYVLAIGSLAATGQRAWYSTPGSNVWVSAPGGDTGSSTNRMPGILSVDREGCTNGYARSDSGSVFDNGQDTANNPNCNYYSAAQGTSFSSPVTAGVVALILQAQPALSWRDVKHILASTATQVHATHTSSDHPLEAGRLAGHTYRRGWTTNAAGYKFHNWYGFGRVNAKSAVEMARKYRMGLPPLIETKTRTTSRYYYESTVTSGDIPDGSPTGFTDTLAVSNHNLEIEAIRVEVSFTHPFVSDIGIELTSPSGTVAQLMLINSGILSLTESNTFVFLANNFYGERTQGDWQLKIIDGKTEQTGQLNSWKMHFYGHRPMTAHSTLASPVNLQESTPSTQTNVNTPVFSWEASNSPNILRYEYCVGTQDGQCDVAPWETKFLELLGAIEGLDLESSKAYYFSVRAVDSSENVSPTVSINWVVP